MIEYETDNSQFFIKNRTYCESISNELKLLNFACSGFCNSYGYELDATLMKNNLSYTFHFYRHQETQNGVIIPKDANVYFGSDLTISGLNEKLIMTIGKSLSRRIFTSKLFKNIIPGPYFFKSNLVVNTELIIFLAKIIQNNEISRFKLKKGRFVCEIDKEIETLSDLFADLEKFILQLECNK